MTSSSVTVPVRGWGSICGRTNWQRDRKWLDAAVEVENCFMFRRVGAHFVWLRASRRDETDVRSLRQTSQSGARTQTMNNFNNQCWPEVRNTKTSSEAAVDVSRTWARTWAEPEPEPEEETETSSSVREDGDALWLMGCLSSEETAALIKMQSDESRWITAQVSCVWSSWLWFNEEVEVLITVQPPRGNPFLPSFYCRVFRNKCPRLSALKCRK